MTDPANEERLILPAPARPPKPPTAVDLLDDPWVSAPDQYIYPPEGAPNVVVILVDDMGFGASSAFGGPCEMPAAERLGQNGLRYTRFHTTSVCSPTRAALLTGRNHHSVGFGTLVDICTGRPGYDARRPASAATIARVLACNGYATGMFGKMHQTPPSEVTPTGPFDRWPTGEGFEKFYGFVGGEMNHWQPQLFNGTTRVEQPRTPEAGYHLSEDLVDAAIGWIRDVRTLRPQNRFFCYVPFGATHSPLHVPREWMEKYRGRFDHGWNEQRELTLRRQAAIGVVPKETELPPWPDEVPHWEELSEDERRGACALMELYAGYAEHMDAQVARLVDELEKLGVLDDTLLFYVLGDNGACHAAGVHGTHNHYMQYNTSSATPDQVLSHLEVLGGPETWPHYPVGWALAMDTPYQWWKSVASHYGGTRNGLIVHWPNGIAARNDLRHQWHHVIDVAPTILAAAGLAQPAIVDGVSQIPVQGTAMNYSFDAPDAADRHTTQYFEILGSRGIYHEGWVACAPHGPVYWRDVSPSLHDDVWELYDTNQDWSQAHNVADLHPKKLQQLQELFLIEAARHNVLPIDGGPLPGHGGGPRSATFGPGVQALPQQVIPDVRNTSHRVSARITVPENGAAGVICAQG